MKSHQIRNNAIIIFISSLVIVLFHNLKIHWYIKDVITPYITALICYILILRKDNKPNCHIYYFLIPIILIIISHFIISIDESNMFINIIILPIILLCFFLSWINPYFSLSKDWLTIIPDIFPKNLFHNLTFLKKEGKNKEERTNNIILGTVCGGIIGIIILSLLTSADAYFDAFISQIFNYIDLSNIILLIISFIILFSIHINILLNKNTKLDNRKIRVLNNTMISTILIIVNSIFILFLLSEISKLTTNFLQLPIEYTYASYAREGFFQLLFVTLINFSIIIFLLYKSNIIKENSKVKKLTLLLITFSILLIFNSYYRMFLYIGHYGITVLRMQVILYLLMELIIFLLLIKKIVKGLKHQDAYLYFIIIISFYIVNLYLCNETFIRWIKL